MYTHTCTHTYRPAIIPIAVYGPLPGSATNWLQDYRSWGTLWTLGSSQVGTDPRELIAPPSPSRPPYAYPHNSVPMVTKAGTGKNSVFMWPWWNSTRKACTKRIIVRDGFCFFSFKTPNAPFPFSPLLPSLLLMIF